MQHRWLCRRDGVSMRHGVRECRRLLRRFWGAVPSLGATHSASGWWDSRCSSCACGGSATAPERRDTSATNTACAVACADPRQFGVAFFVRPGDEFAPEELASRLVPRVCRPGSGVCDPAARTAIEHFGLGTQLGLPEIGAPPPFTTVAGGGIGDCAESCLSYDDCHTVSFTADPGRCAIYDYTPELRWDLTGTTLVRSSFCHE